MRLFRDSNDRDNRDILYESKHYRSIYLGITIFHSVTNLLHLIADLLMQQITWCQIALMAFLLLVGLLLSLISSQ